MPSIFSIYPLCLVQKVPNLILFDNDVSKIELFQTRRRYELGSEIKSSSPPPPPIFMNFYF